MAKNKTYYFLDVYDEECAMTGFPITKWKAIQWFIGFLQNPEYKKITFIKHQLNYDKKR